MTNLRASMKQALRPALRAEILPEDNEPFYRAVDADDNIWFYQANTNGGAPFKALRVWYNPGDVDVYVTNYNFSGYSLTATTTVTVADALVNDFETGLGVYDNVLKLTFITEIDYGDGFVESSKTEQYFVSGLGMVGYYEYPEVTSLEPDYIELLLSARLGTSIYENPVKINSASLLSDAIIRSSYAVTLDYTGGVSPHKFSVISGALPQGVTLNENGQFSGTVLDQNPGLKTFTVRLTDAYYQTYNQEFSITVR